MGAKLEVLRGPFPVLRERLDFGEFHPDLAGNYVEVWVNLSDDFQGRVNAHQVRWDEFERQREALRTAIAGGQLTDEEAETARAELEQRSEAMRESTAGIYAEMWNCTVEEYRQLVVLDAALTTWLYVRTWELVREYREGRAKVRSG